MKDVTAIIPHYWHSRRQNLPGIVNALLESRAREVVIWNNTALPVAVQGAMVIEGGANWGIAARFAAAYLARTELVLFQDNDLMVEPGTIACLAEGNPFDGESLEFQGRNLGDWGAPYTRSTYVDAYQINAPQPADVGLSRVSLMTRTTAMYLAGVIPPDVTDDDLWTSRYCNIRIVPTMEDSEYRNLPETEGLCRDVDAHVARRDALVRQLWAKKQGFYGGADRFARALEVELNEP